MSMFNRFFLTLTVFAVLVVPQTVFAEDKETAIKIAVVDLEKIISDSSAGKSIQKQLKTRRESFQKEFSGRENKLMTAQKALAQEKKDITPEEFSKKRQDFEKQLLETRNLFQKRRSALDKGLGNALADLRKNIIQVTAEVADEGGFQVVLTRSSVVVIQKEMDITESVLKRLNKKISNIKLDVDQ